MNETEELLCAVNYKEMGSQQSQLISEYYPGICLAKTSDDEDVVSNVDVAGDLQAGSK